MAIVTILSHEWGHHAEYILDMYNGENYNIDLELASDCFAGAFARWSNEQGYLEPGDINEARAIIVDGGDHPAVPWDDPLAHGTAAERLTAYDNGLNNGTDACFDW